MRVWVDVYDTQDRKIGTVYSVTAATVIEVLDGVGNASLNWPAAAEDGALFTQECRVRIWAEQDDHRLYLGGGILREINIDDSESNAKFAASGPDALDALQRKSVFLRRLYTGESISNVATSLIGLIQGWALDCDESGLTTARFEGVSVNKALIRLVQENGLHLRAGSDAHLLQIGAFGEDNGITCVAPQTVTHDLDGRPDIMLISHIQRKINSRDVINYIEPVGAGVDTDTMLTLENSSHSITTFVDDLGVTHYILSDADSIAAYGQIEKTVQFNQITDADALFAAATAWLERNAVPLTTYGVSLEKCEQEIHVGDKIRVIYKGIVETETGYRQYLDINDLFWIMKAQKGVAEGGVVYTLDIASIDRETSDSTDVVVSAIEKAEALTVASSNFISIHTATTNPTVGDDEGDNYGEGTIWINTSTKVVFVCADASAGAAVWSQIAPIVNAVPRFAIIEDQKAQNTAGGTSATTTWSKRDINTEVVDANSIVQIAVTTANTFTVIAGTWDLFIESPFLGSATANTSVRIRLWNTTTGQEIVRTPNRYISGALDGDTAQLRYQLTSNGTDEYEVQYYSTSGRATNGLGLAINEASAVERYTRVTITEALQPSP